MNKLRCCAASAAALVALCGHLCAQVPDLMNYQGRLVDNTNLVNDAVEIVFRIFDAETGGNLHYAETQEVVVVDGLLSAYVGASNVSAGAWQDTLTNSAVYLQVSVDGTAMLPRERMASVPYAGMAAEVAADAIETHMIAEAAVTSNKIDWTSMPAGLQDGDDAGLASGFGILGTNDAPPAGFSYSGDQISAGGWSSLKPMLFPVSEPDAVAVGSNIYVIGGFDGTAVIASNQVYEPLSETWTNRTPMPTARSHLSVVALDGRIYALGGKSAAGYTSTNEVYDPVSDTWTNKAPMPFARSDFACVAENGKIYAIGGEIGSNVVTGIVSAYDHLSDSWAAVSNLPTARAYMDAAPVNGKVYAMGGYDGTNTLSVNEVYDPALDTWTPGTPMPRPRSDLSLGILNGLIYAIGGHDDIRWLARNERYDPGTDTWSQKLSMFTERGLSALKTVQGRIFVMGGRDSLKAKDIFDVIEAYSPERKYYIFTKD